MSARYTRLLLASVLAVAIGACSGKGGAAPEPASPEASPPPEGGAEESPMPSGFQAARQAFAAAVAGQVSLPVGDVAVGPPDQPSADRMPEKVGGFWALRARLQDDPSRDVYGWANGAGVTASVAAGLGAVLDEAGLWSESPTWSARTAAERVLWAMGGGRELFVDRYNGKPPPKLALADGSGTLTFFARIPGAAGRPGPDRTAQVTVPLAADRSARVEEAPLDGQ